MKIHDQFENRRLLLLLPYWLTSNLTPIRMANFGMKDVICFMRHWCLFCPCEEFCPCVIWFQRSFHLRYHSKSLLLFGKTSLQDEVSYCRHRLSVRVDNLPLGEKRSWSNTVKQRTSSSTLLIGNCILEFHLGFRVLGITLVLCSKLPILTSQYGSLFPTSERSKC